MGLTENYKVKVEDPAVQENNEFVFAGKSEDFMEEEPVEVFINNKNIVITRFEDELFAVNGICTHAYAELIEGGTDGHLIYCPLHFACFDMRDGTPLDGPTDIPLDTYEIKEVDGSVWVKVN